MDRLKTFRKYIIWIIAFYIFTMICTYVGLNATYRDMNRIGTWPDGLIVDIAQATSVNGRIYGKVTSNEENNLEGKYIKVQIYTKKGILAGCKYLKIENTKLNEPKKFAVTFTYENIGYYKVEIVEDSVETQKEVIKITDLYKDIFTDEELRMYAIVSLVLTLILI
jgi:hypothetical protein